MKSNKRLFIEKYFDGESEIPYLDNLTDELSLAIEKDDGWIKIEEGCEMPSTGTWVLVEYENGAFSAYNTDISGTNFKTAFGLIPTNWKYIKPPIK